MHLLDINHTAFLQARARYNETLQRDMAQLHITVHVVFYDCTYNSSCCFLVMALLLSYIVHHVIHLHITFFLLQPVQSCTNNQFQLVMTDDHLLSNLCLLSSPAQFNSSLYSNVLQAINDSTLCHLMSGRSY